MFPLPKKSFPLLAAGLIFSSLHTANASVTMVWASEVGLQSYKSDGTAALDSSFVAEIGIFQPGFTPNSTNLGDWTTRWQSFGSVPYNEVDQYFGGTTTMHDNATAPAGSQIYLWLRKDTGVPEWFVATNDSSDGNAADNWIMPEIAGTDQTDRPMYFDLNYLTAPDLSVPFGKTPGGTGDGDYNETPVTFTVQTHTVVVPEPSGLICSLLASTLILRRTRPAAFRAAGEGKRMLDS